MVVDPQLADLAASGEIKFEVRHYPFGREEAFLAVEAVECAGDQGYWWAMHDALMLNGADPAKLEEYARAMGLDVAAFSTCVNEGTYESLAQEQAQSAQAEGIKGTPTFLINGRQLELTAWDDVMKAVNKELNR
jgi:protein-disulfide isomerase